MSLNESILENEVLKKIKEWHPKKFPNESDESQLAKVEEEAKELTETNTSSQIIKECCDIYIATQGYIDRFKKYPYIVSFIQSMAFQNLKLITNNPFEEILNRIEEIDKREYHKVNGITRHIEKGKKNERVVKK